MNQYAVYFQDDWRLTDRVTVNAGIRYDLVTGYQIDQSQTHPNYIALTAAGAAGRFDGVPGFEKFAKKAQEDKNNIQPRVGVVWDIKGDGTDVVRAGWGVYMDMGTPTRTSCSRRARQGKGFGAVLSVDNQAGIRNPDGSFFAVGQPISNISSQNQAEPERAAVRPVRPIRACRCRYTHQSVGRLVAPVDGNHGLRPWTTCAPTATTSTRGRDQHARDPNGARRLALPASTPTRSTRVSPSAAARASTPR